MELLSFDVLEPKELLTDTFLVYAHRAAQDSDGWLRLANVPAPVQRLLHLVGLDGLMAMYATLQAALPST